MKKTIIRLLSLALILAAVFSMSACGSGIRVRAVRVRNDDFYESIFGEYVRNDTKIPKDTVFMPVIKGIADTPEQFMRKFLWRYDSTTGMALLLEVCNKTKSPVTITGLLTENNGNKDTYISSCINRGETVEVPAGETKEVRVCFIGNGGLYANEEFIGEVFCDMPMQLCLRDANGEQFTEKVRLKPEKPVEIENP